MKLQSIIQYQIEENSVIALDNEGNRIGEIDFPFAQEYSNVVIMNHTFVEPNYRGQKIADKLFELAINEIEKRQLKVIPTCSYAVLKFNRNPKLQFLLN